jgi:hypothetical protein
MNFAGNFIHIGTLEIAALKQRVLELPEQQWRREAFRQQRYEVHRDTQTVPLVFDPDFRHTHPTRLPVLQEFEPLIRPALKMAADHFDDSPKGRELFEEHGMGYFVRASLVRLQSGGAITEHTDNNFSLVHSHRVHLPIITNAEVGFTVGDEVINMKEGELWEINNRRLHSVKNAGAEVRVHLILDYVIPGEKCCCGEKLHPLTACNPQACEKTDHLKIECVCFQAL